MFLCLLVIVQSMYELVWQGFLCLFALHAQKVAWASSEEMAAAFMKSVSMMAFEKKKLGDSKL